MHRVRLSTIWSAMPARVRVECALVLLFFLAIGGTAEIPRAEASLCGPTLVRDFEAPLRSLPPAEPLPEILPFAPAGVEAYVGPRLEGSPGLLHEHSVIGLHLGGPEDVDLGWTIEVLVSFPGAGGSPGWVVSAARAQVPSPSFKPAVITRQPLFPGTYRVDLAFLDKDGATLGSYFEYLQVVPFVLKPKLVLRRKAGSAAGNLELRVENLGTRLISFGAAYGLERYEDGEWQTVPQRRGFFAWKASLSAGRAGPCQAVRIPAALGSGRYRVRKDIKYFVKRAVKVRRTFSKAFFVRP